MVYSEAKMENNLKNGSITSKAKINIIVVRNLFFKTIEANNAMFCFDPNPLCNGGIHTQHQFSPAISRNLIVDFGYFH